MDRSFLANPWLVCAAPLGHGGGVWKAPTGRGIPAQGVTLGREVPGFSVLKERRISRNNQTAQALCGVPSERTVRSGLEGVFGIPMADLGRLFGETRSVTDEFHVGLKDIRGA